MGVQSDGKTGKNPRESKWLKVVGVALVVMAVFLIYKTSTTQAETIKNGDLRILKKEVTSKAKFYPVTVDGVRMEVVAVKASDGSVRTAFNTCQVCFDSGRGYYIQEGDELVCQNCGNRFQIDRVEKIKNGCNPVPITADLKTDDGKYITISRTLLAKAKGLFGNWKR